MPIPNDIIAQAGRFVGKNLIWLAVVLALVAALAVQQVRIEGLRIGAFGFDLVHVEGWKPKAQRLQQVLDDIEQAEELARLKARAARIEREAIYRGIAERIDDNAQEQLAAAGDATERFIAAGGVRAQADRSLCPAARTATGDRGSENPRGTGGTAELDAAEGGPTAGVPAGYVLVRADDVRLCTRNTIKAEAGHDLAVQLKQASQAKSGE